jgi:UrcA family protein
MSRFSDNASSGPRAFTAGLGVLTIAALLASPTRASANGPLDDGLQTKVNYSRQDLATARGARALYRRIARAAEDVCPGYDSRALDPMAASEECQREAIARAIGQIGSSRLSAINAQAVARHG